MGKAALQVPSHSANEIVNLELGLKPVRMLVWERKLQYYKRISSPRFSGSNYVKLCLDMHVALGKDSPYIAELLSICESLKVNLDDSFNINDAIHVWGKDMVLSSADDKSSLGSCALPSRWWRKSAYVCDSILSKTISEFRCGSTGVGEADNSFQFHELSTYSGRVPICPGCRKSDNKCSIMWCPALPLFISVILSQLTVQHCPASSSPMEICRTV